MTEVLVVIPARWGSSRFPGKALADLEGAPLVVRVAQAALRMESADRVIIAADDERIVTAVRDAGYEVVLTGEHASGSDRVGEVAATIDAKIIVNLQGDEPLLDPNDADRLVAALQADPYADVATLAHPCRNEDEWRDPNAVKVVCDDHGKALLFSRAPVPSRHPASDIEAWRLARRHIGIYAYRAAALKQFLDLPPHPLELSEGLEQLRAQAAGLHYLVLDAKQRPVGVDTPEDLETVRALWRAASEDSDSK